MRELHGGQLVEGGALQAGVAHPPGQLDGAFDELARRRVALVLKADDDEHGRLDVGITAASVRASANRAWSSPGGASSDMMPGA